jgi:hypothetical protein
VPTPRQPCGALLWVVLAGVTVAHSAVAEERELTLGERVPIALLVSTPTGENARVRSSEVIRVVSDVLRAHTDFSVQLVEPNVLVECKGRLLCLVEKVGGGRHPRPDAPDYLLVFSSVTRAGEPDRLSAQLVDVDRSSDLAARAVGPEDEWAAELEITLNESALVTERTAVSGVEDAERVIDGWIRERFATSFEGTGHWEPYGEVVIEASTGGLELAIDGQPVGATVAGTTRVREVRAGIRQVTLSAPRLEPYRGQIEVVQGRATTHQPDLVWVGPGRVFRTATIISGAVLATAGIVATVAALASHDGDVSTYCFTGSPGCSSGSSFESSGFSPSDADSLRSANTSGPLLLPLGYSLIGAGATWTIGALYSAEEDVPWLPLAIGAGVGVLAYSLSAASSTRPE